MDLIEATMKALQGKLEEKPNKANAEINAKILEPNANKAELQKNGYNVSRANGFTSVKRADRVNDFREVSVFDDGTVMTVNDDTIIDEPVNKDVFDAKSFLDTDRKKPYEAPNKVSKFKMNKDTIAQADEEIADAEREKKDNPEDADILDKNVIEPWKKLKDKADAENKEMLNKKENRRVLGEHVIIENKECLKEETLTWEDIMDNAEGTTFGQQALKVKDQARAEVEELMRKDGIDVDNLENVEDEIEKYVVDHNIKFADNGCILKEAYGPNVNYKNIKVGDNVLKYLRGNAVNGTITKIDTIGAGGMSSDYAIIEFEDGSTSKVATQDIHPEKYDGKYRDYSIYLLNESVVSDYTLSEIKVESVEDEIEKYCKDNNIKFDTHGNLLDKKTEAKYLPLDKKIFNRTDIQNYINKNNLKVKNEYDKDYKTNSAIATGYIKVYCTPEQQADLKSLINKSKTSNKVTEDISTDLGEDFYEKICRAYVDTANLEWVTTSPENNNSVVHGYFADDSTSAKWDYGAKVTPENFKDVAYEGHTDEEIENGDVEWYDYDTWEDFYEDYVKDEIIYDMEDMGVYSDGTSDYMAGVNHWDFYISEEDLTKLGLWNEEMRKDYIGESKKQESAVSDYTLSEIKKILDSEETEYGYSLKITNSGADAETKTLDLDKSDLQAIYDALSKNKVTESKLDNGNVQLGEAKVYTPDTMGKDYDNYTDTFNKLQKDIKALPDAKLDYKGICSLIAGYIEGVVGIEDNPEAMSKINIDLVREIADAVFNEDDVWEPMDDFIYSEIYAKLDIK